MYVLRTRASIPTCRSCNSFVLPWLSSSSALLVTEDSQGGFITLLHCYVPSLLYVILNGFLIPRNSFTSSQSSIQTPTDPLRPTPTLRLRLRPSKTSTARCTWSTRSSPRRSRSNKEKRAACLLHRHYETSTRIQPQ